MMRVSAIIPVYNRQRFIGRCLDSICQQSYPDLEIIVVDDGSTDRSREIVNEYARKDPRIRLIAQENSGTYKARRRGIRESGGDAILNLDSDDYLEEDTVSLLVKKMTETDADIVVGDYYVIKGNTKELIKNHIPDPYDKVEALRFMLSEKLSVHLWGRLYKSELLKDIQLPLERPFTEDVLTNFTILSRQPLRFAKVDRPIYNYIIHDANLSYAGNREAVEGFFSEFALAEGMLDETTSLALEPELALYRSRDWIVYCRRKGDLCKDSSYRRAFFKRNYAKAKPLLPWYLKMEMILFKWQPGLGRQWFPFLKGVKQFSEKFRFKSSGLRAQGHSFF